jgi:hypothetical protein
MHNMHALTHVDSCMHRYSACVSDDRRERNAASGMHGEHACIHASVYMSQSGNPPLCEVTVYMHVCTEDWMSSRNRANKADT